MKQGVAYVLGNKTGRVNFKILLTLGEAAFSGVLDFRLAFSSADTFASRLFCNRKICSIKRLHTSQCLKVHNRARI